MKKLAAISLLFTTIFFSCETNELPQQEFENEGEIYLKIVQDLSHPPNNNAGWCDIISGCYTDNNSDMPNNASFDQFYGPLEPGTYQASFCFNRTNPSSNIISFSYTLQSPGPGKKRMYTRMVRDYNSNNNRCVALPDGPSYLTYRDEFL